MSQLILVRHGQSEWNALGIWTGWNDINLNEKGKNEAKEAAYAIKDIPIHTVFVSDLKRSQQTYQEIKNALHLENIPVIIASELKERNYGDLAGKNKLKVKEEFGEKQFMQWRRGWNTPIPNGESLKDVFERAVPYYKKTIVPLLKAGKSVLISGHENSLRALVKYLETIPDDAIESLEIGTGEVYVYSFDAQGTIQSKEIRSVNKEKAKF